MNTFLSKKQHEKLRNQRILSWIRNLLCTDGYITFRESFQLVLENFTKKQKDVSAKLIFAPDEDLDECVFWFDIFAHDVVYQDKTDHPEFWFRFLYGGKVYVGMRLPNHDGFDFLFEFYSRKLNVKFGEKKHQSARLEESITWAQAHVLISKILKYRTETIPKYK